MTAKLKVILPVTSDKITVISVLESFEHALTHFILFNLTVMTCAIYRRVRQHVTML